MHNATQAAGGFTASGPLAFLNDWTYKLGAELLTPFGRKQNFDFGVASRQLYGKLLNNFTEAGTIPVMRTQSQDRMVKSKPPFLTAKKETVRAARFTSLTPFSLLPPLQLCSTLSPASSAWCVVLPFALRRRRTQRKLTSLRPQPEYQDQVNIEIELEARGFNLSGAPYEICTNSNNAYGSVGSTAATVSFGGETGSSQPWLLLPQP